MFTGIVEEVGTIARVEQAGGDLRIRVAAKLVTQDMKLGDSVAVSGCCLTVVDFDREGFSAELSRETVAKTAPRWQQGARVNLERAMAAGGRFGGHMVSGHVEGVGRVTDIVSEPGAFVLTVSAPERLAGYLAPKGSVTVDGVSLTVVDCGGPGGSDPALAPWEFTLWLIPHTLEATTLGELERGSLVNLEADLIAKYLERLQLMKEQNRVPH
ncbi:MAG TPA: riboflavin synthase [Trueperaceae bacterium]